MMNNRPSAPLPPYNGYAPCHPWHPPPGRKHCLGCSDAPQKDAQRAALCGGSEISDLSKVTPLLSGVQRHSQLLPCVWSGSALPELPVRRRDWGPSKETPAYAGPRVGSSVQSALAAHRARAASPRVVQGGHICESSQCRVKLATSGRCCCSKLFPGSSRSPLLQEKRCRTGNRTQIPKA